jgi:hypothetical protein
MATCTVGSAVASTQNAANQMGVRIASWIME